MAQREPDECIGGGGAPSTRSEQAEFEGRTSGVCPVCGERLNLDRGLIPRHKRPERLIDPAASSP
jgi:hypothetical protein